MPREGCQKCSTSSNSKTVQPIALKFGVWLGYIEPTLAHMIDPGCPPHVRTCTPLFCNSETTGPIALKFGLWLGYNESTLAHMLDPVCPLTCARAQHTSIHLLYLSRPLVHRRLRRLTGWLKISTDSVHLPVCSPHLFEIIDVPTARHTTLNQGADRNCRCHFLHISSAIS